MMYPPLPPSPAEPTFSTPPSSPPSTSPDMSSDSPDSSTAGPSPCGFAVNTSQISIEVHEDRDLDAKAHECTCQGCTYASADASGLHSHLKSCEGYVPKVRKVNRVQNGRATANPSQSSSECALSTEQDEDLPYVPQPFDPDSGSERTESAPASPTADGFPSLQADRIDVPTFSNAHPAGEGVSMIEGRDSSSAEDASSDIPYPRAFQHADFSSTYSWGFNPTDDFSSDELVPSFMPAPSGSISGNYSVPSRSSPAHM